MNVSPFAIQLAIVVVLVLGVIAWTLRFVLRSGEGGPEPLIRARAKELQKGWYQLELRIANRAPYGMTGVSLRRIKPRAARLMAPITSVSTRKGKFQVWSDPTTDEAATSIPVHLELGPHEGRHGFAAPTSEAQTMAWLFIPGEGDPSDLTLELAFVDRAKNLRRFKFAVALSPQLAPLSPK